ncbi:MAG: GxxExxY protein [Phycisphaeraceae bacterium]|nr:MAG: GxxExxY protein [Phycisphaeraceae bacterium]
MISSSASTAPPRETFPDKQRNRTNDANGDTPMPHQQRRSTPLEDLDPELTNVSRKVIGAAIEVHKALGPGFDRDVYRKALCMELDELDVAYKLDHAVSIEYKGKAVGEHRLNMFVNDRFTVELMAEHRVIDGFDRTRLRAQLRAADLELGLIINFGERRLKDGLVRVLNPDKLNAMRGEDGGDYEGDYEDDDS